MYEIVKLIETHARGRQLFSAPQPLPTYDDGRQPGSDAELGDEVVRVDGEV